MSITIEVNATDQTVFWQRQPEAGWDDPLNGRGAGRITFAVPVADLGTFTPGDGQQIEILENGTVRFGGLLIEPEEVETEDTGIIWFTCVMSDYNILADRRIVGETWDAVAFETIVSGIVFNHMDGEGITIAGVEAGDAQSLTANLITATEAFNALSDQTQKVWRIDETKDLNFKDVDSDPAPADFDGDTFLMGTIRVRSDRQKYRNQVTVRAGTPEFPIIATSGNLTEQAARAAIEGTSGIYESVTDEPDITNADVAMELAGDLLERFDEVTQVVIGETRTAGYRSGQFVNVDLPRHGINDVGMVIESVTARIVSIGDDDDEIWYTVTAITGDPFGGWMEHFRQAPPATVPLTFENTPGLFRVDPKPGAVVHDPLPSGREWFQSPQTGPIDTSGNAIGLTHQEAGKGGFMYLIRRGGLANTGGCGGGLFPGDEPSGPACFVNRQSILESYVIEADDSIATTPSQGTSWDELFSSSFKGSIVVDPTNTMIAFVERDPGSEPFFGVVLAGVGLLGSVEATGMDDNNNSSEGIWIGNYVYIPGTDGGSIFVFNVTDPNNPTLEDEFATSATGIIKSVTASADGNSLYAVETGGGGLLIALDITDPSAITEDDTLTLDSTIYDSLDIDLNSSFADPQIGLARRDGASDVRVTNVPVTGPTTFGTQVNALVSLATVVFDGAHTIFDSDTLISFRSNVAAAPVNSYEAHVFKIDPDDGTSFVKTLSYNHGTVGALSPPRSLTGNRILLYFAFGTDVEISFSQLVFAAAVPLTIDCPLRYGFGGTGLAKAAKGDLFYANRVLPDTPRGFGSMTRLPIEDLGDVLSISGELPVWQSFPELAGFHGLIAPTDDLLFTTGEVSVISGAVANIDELEATISSGVTYYFRAELYYNADPALGHRYGIAGTAVGDVIYQVRSLDDQTGDYSIIISGLKQALGETAGELGAEVGYTVISGSIECVGDGTIVPQFGVF